MNEHVTMSDALRNVDVLDELPLNDDDPCIESGNRSLVYHVCFDTKFEDKNGFVTGISKYIEEATHQAKLNKILMEGDEYAVMLYTYRCCSRAIPQIRSNEQSNRSEIYVQAVNVMQNEISKLFKLMHFVKSSVELFCKEISRLSKPERKKEFVSEAYLLTIGKFINMFAVLDELKNIKSSVKNDFSAYRRAAQFIKVIGDSLAMQESQNLSVFLANNDIIRNMLTDKLKDIEGFEDILCDVLNASVSLYETKLFLYPSEKHMLVKVIGFCLCLIDSDNSNIYKLDGKKRICLSYVDKILQFYPVVPLYGDMQIAPFNYVKRSINYDATKWSNCLNEEKPVQADIGQRLVSYRSSYVNYLIETAKLNNETSSIGHMDSTCRTESNLKAIYSLSISALQLLSEWTSFILEFFSWKLSHPVKEENLPSDCKINEEYERATKYNLNFEEKSALVELIGMIKSLERTMEKLDVVFVEAISYCIYLELQTFIQVNVQEMIAKTTSRKRDLTKSILMAIRDTCADYISASEQALEQCKSKKCGDKENITLRKRYVGPSSTQLYMVRTMVESIITDKAIYGKRTLRKDIDHHHLLVLQNFHKVSFFWEHLLNFKDSVKKCCDLSSLWYREFYLELTMGNKVQFPIDMSVPWILTEHALETADQSLVENIFYTMDLYNDAAQCALYVFKKQHLFDEVEAEVDLCFDQLIFKMADKIFTHYKCLAACLLLEKKFRYECEVHNLKIKFPTSKRYVSLMLKRHVQILSRSINLVQLMSQRIILAIKKSIDMAICKYESQNLSSIVELDRLIEVNRLTHSLLSEYLTLDDFNMLFKEVNKSITNNYDRITLHTFWELTYDFVPHYRYDGSLSRFSQIKDVNIAREKFPSCPDNLLWGSKELFHANEILLCECRNYLDERHFKSLCKLLGYKGISVVLEELMKIIKNLIDKCLVPSIEKVRAVHPKLRKFPRLDYGAAGILSSEVVSLREILRLPDIHDVFHSFRELGNAIIFCHSLEKALSLEEISDLLHAAPFQNVIPNLHLKDCENIELRVQKHENRHSSMQIAKMAEHFGNHSQAQSAGEADLLTRERLCIGLTFFDLVLSKLRSYLTHEIWYKNRSTTMDSEDSPEFHNLWSSIVFVICCSPAITNDDLQMCVEEVYGESLIWAGCALMHLLGQTKRFELFDCSFHILNMSKIDQKDAHTYDSTLNAVIERIKKLRILHDQIFTMLYRYARTEEDAKGNESYIPPPIHPFCSDSEVCPPIWD